jgi:hypothetical protein
MKHNLLPFLLAFALTAFRASGVDSVAVKKLFAKPPPEYSTAPLWVWNDRLTDDQIRGTLRDLAGQQVKQVFVHPRPGLMTPYLSPEWFRLWKVALDEATKLDMLVWIYDENSYPSGFAGGWVPELMPEARGRGLVFSNSSKSNQPPVWATNSLAVFRLDAGKAEDVSAKLKAGEALPEGRYLGASVKRAANSPWNGGRSYVDLLYPGVTKKFLDVTLESYRKAVGAEFGKRVPGSFTDEPELVPAGGWPWTEDLPQQFERRWGYSLIESLASLNQPVGDWQRVRHNYFQTLLDLFVERWAKPYYDYCASNKLEFTGHYWDHSWPNCVGVPDNMAMSAWQQRPGIDILMNQYAEHTGAQFGNVRACREISSLANQFGRRTLVELYGAGGWDLRFEDMKRIGDWLEVLGVNTLDQHLSYVTIRGARKRDHPQSFSYHEPWWDSYRASAAYFERVTAALTQGEQINRVLVIEPTTTAWMYQGAGAKLKAIGDEFFKLLMALEAAQIEYDIGCEDVLANHSSVVGNTLKVGRRAYPVVVLPPLMENVNARTFELGEQFLQAGGTVVCLGEAPSRIGGELSERAAQAVSQAGWITVKTETAPEVLRRWSGADGFAINRAAGDKGILFHHRRTIADGQILFLVNTSIEAPADGTFESALSGVERWNLDTGGVEAFVFEKTVAGVKASFHLPPSGSVLLFLSEKSRQPAPTLAETATSISASGPMSIRRVGPNVLTLDFVDVTAGGETRTNQYFYAANRFVWQKNGVERNPWDSAVQFQDEIIKRTFPANSGFAASYHFTVEGAVPANLAIVIERPDLYFKITCNGKPITARPGDWWLDRAFGRLDLAGVVRHGDNVVTIEASPMTMLHELEPAYLLGDFTLRPARSGFAVEPERPLAVGKWNEQGNPFYSQGVAYQQRFQVSQKKGSFVVALPAWYGSVAKVLVNGKLAGHITAPPWECDVTSAIRSGANTVEVVAIGTLKNTLGPHHGNPALGSAWPGNFQKGPANGPPAGGEYHTVGYGLFEPFTLSQRMAK